MAIHDRVVSATHRDVSLGWIVIEPCSDMVGAIPQ